MTPPIPPGWQAQLGDEVEKPYYQTLQAFLERERAQHTVFPPEARRVQRAQADPLSSRSRC